jgi:hypothetical protein
MSSNHNEKMDISKEPEEATGEVVNSPYDDFIREYNDNLADGMSQNRSYLSASVSHPRQDTPTLSSILSWELDSNFFENKLIFNEKKSENFKIFLDIRMDGVRLFFPGGNLFSVEISTNSDPVGLHTYISVS